VVLDESADVVDVCVVLAVVVSVVVGDIDAETEVVVVV